jgi:hypothetical protein
MPTLDDCVSVARALASAQQAVSSGSLTPMMTDLADIGARAASSSTADEREAVLEEIKRRQGIGDARARAEADARARQAAKRAETAKGKIEAGAAGAEAKLNPSSSSSGLVLGLLAGTAGLLLAASGSD